METCSEPSHPQQGLGMLKQLHLLSQESLRLLAVDSEPCGPAFCTSFTASAPLRVHGLPKHSKKRGMCSKYGQRQPAW